MWTGQAFRGWQLAVQAETTVRSSWNLWKCSGGSDLFLNFFAQLIFIFALFLLHFFLLLLFSLRSHTSSLVGMTWSPFSFLVGALLVCLGATSILPRPSCVSFCWNEMNQSLHEYECVIYVLLFFGVFPCHAKKERGFVIHISKRSHHSALPPTRAFPTATIKK